MKSTSFEEQFIETTTNNKFLEEVGLCERRKKIWTIAFHKSGGNEQKAHALYFEYRAQAVKDEIEVAKALLEEPSVNIVESYMSKMEQRRLVKKSTKNNTSRDTISLNHKRKECYKCRRIVPLPRNTCPDCNRNTFVYFS